jgi:uncharacterized OsmC-like protein
MHQVDSSTDSASRIKAVLDRNVRALDLRPSVGQGTAITKVRLAEGLACEIQDGPWRLTAGMSEKSGGAGTAPNPGILGRASLGSCLAIGYDMWAARYGIPIHSLEIEVQADYDTRSEFALHGIKPGYRQVRCIVNITSDAPEADVRRLLDEANAASSYLHVWQDPQDVRLDIRVNGQE